MIILTKAGVHWKVLNIVVKIGRKVFCMRGCIWSYLQSGSTKNQQKKVVYKVVV